LLASSELDRLSVVLVSARNPLNIGAAARAMLNFGFSRLRVVNPYPLAFREARSAVGASEVLRNAKEFNCVAEAVADCQLVIGTTAARNRQLRQPLRALPEAARSIRRRLGSSRIALLFGAEKRGLSNEDLSHCHWLLRIPTCAEHGSMNLGQAVAVCLYDVVRSRGIEPRTEKIEPARAGEVEAMTLRLFEALRLSGYVNPQSAASTEAKLRRMVRRLRIPAADAETWFGIFRQILWKVGKSQSGLNSDSPDSGAC
jgi:TrmH family RNA methyltransferase